MPNLPSTADNLWHHADFRRLWAAQSVSVFGARIAREALPLAALFSLQASPSQLGILAALTQGPALLVGLLAAGQIDRRSRRPLLIASDLLRALLLLSVPLAAWLGQLSMPLLYLVAGLAGAAHALFDIADHAYLPSLLKPEQLLQGNAKLATTDALAEVGGPALAGLMVQWLSAPLTLAGGALGYLWSAAVLARIRQPEQPAPQAEDPSSWCRGAAEAWSRPLLRAILLHRLTANLFGSFLAALYSIYAIRELGLSAGMLGLTIAAGGLGGLLGALFLPWLSRRLPMGQAILVAAFGCGTLNLLLPLAQGGPLSCMLFLVVAQLGGDALGVAANIATDSLRQQLLPTHLLGRVGAIFHAGSGLAAITGALLGGLLAEQLGLRATVLVSTLGLALAPIWLWASPLRHLRELSTAATPV